MATIDINNYFEEVNQSTIYSAFDKILTTLNEMVNVDHKVLFKSVDFDAAGTAEKDLNFGQAKYDTIKDQFKIIFEYISGTNPKQNNKYSEFIDLFKTKKDEADDEDNDVSNYKNSIFKSKYYKDSGFVSNVNLRNGITINNTTNASGAKESINISGRLIIDHKMTDNDEDKKFFVFGDLHGDIFPLLGVLSDYALSDINKEIVIILLGDVFDPYHNGETYNTTLAYNRFFIDNVNVIMLYFLCYLIFKKHVNIFWVLGNHDLAYSLHSYIGLYFYYLPNIVHDYHTRGIDIGNFFVSSDIILKLNKRTTTKEIFFSHANNCSTKDNVYNKIDENQTMNKRVPNERKGSTNDLMWSKSEVHGNKRLRIYGHENSQKNIVISINNGNIRISNKQKTAKPIIPFGDGKFHYKVQEQKNISLDFTSSIFKKTTSRDEKCDGTDGPKVNRCKSYLLDISNNNNDNIFIQNTGHIFYMSGIKYIPGSDDYEICTEIKNLSKIHFLNHMLFFEIPHNEDQYKTVVGGVDDNIIIKDIRDFGTLQKADYGNINIDIPEIKNIQEIETILNLGFDFYSHTQELIRSFIIQLFMNYETVEKYNMFYKYIDFDDVNQDDKQDIQLLIYPINIFDFKKYLENTTYLGSLSEIPENKKIILDSKDRFKEKKIISMIEHIYKGMIKYYDSEVFTSVNTDDIIKIIDFLSYYYIKYSLLVLQNNITLSQFEFINNFCSYVFEMFKFKKINFKKYQEYLNIQIFKLFLNLEENDRLLKI